MPTAAIIGAGHNGLVAACYLAQAGYDVTIYEKSAQTGGLCVNEELWPGYTVSVWANWSGMFMPQIASDLGLTLPDILDTGEAILTAEDGCVAGDTIYIDGVTAEDRAGLAALDKDFDTLAAALADQFLSPAPTKKAFLQQADKAGLSRPAQDLAGGAFGALAQEYIPHRELATAIGYESFTHPLHPGSAYGHIHMRVPGAWGADWGMIKGGMGALSAELAKRARTLGVNIVTSCGVQAIIHDDRTVSTLTLENGENVQADLYLCGTDYPVLQHLLGRPAQTDLRDHKYGNANIHVKLARLPRFPALESNGLAVPPTLTLVPSWDELQKGYAQYRAGDNIDHPVISLGIPSLADPDRAPPDRHFMCIHPDHAPLTWQDGPWHDEARRAYIDHILGEVARYAPDIRDCIEDARLFCAADLQARYGAASGHCFHGDLSWPFALEDRLPGYGAGPQTDLTNLYLCGGACAPGGTVTGAPGYRAAQAILNRGAIHA